METDDEYFQGPSIAPSPQFGTHSQSNIILNGLEQQLSEEPNPV